MSKVDKHPDRYDKAIEILQKTNDGDDLEGLQLYMIQEAVNDNLNEKGWEMFYELHDNICKVVK